MAKYLGETSLQELVTKTKALVATKQDILTAGENITISGTTISASGTKNISGNIRITDLNAGIYKWTSNNNSLFYNGSSGNGSVTDTHSGDYVLIVSKNSATSATWSWILFDADGNTANGVADGNFFVGKTTTGSGTYTRLNDKFVPIASGNNKIYGTSSLGLQTTYNVSNTATASSIAQRDANSQVLVAETPTADGHATSKKYVDTQLSSKQDTLTFDTTPTSASTNPVTSGGVYTALGNKVDKVTGKGLSTDDFVSSNYYTKTQIDGLVSAVYKPAGSVAFASLPTLSASVLGNVYNVTDAFTTTSNFVEGAGNSYPAGTNVVVVDTGSSTYKFDVLAGFVDLSGYVPTTRKVNNKALSSDITLTASDVGALSSSTTYVSSVNGSSGAITGIQTTGNLVTSFSSTTSDSKYPSEKLVKTSLDAKQDTMTEITTQEVDALFE